MSNACILSNMKGPIHTSAANAPKHTDIHFSMQCPTAHKWLYFYTLWRTTPPPQQCLYLTFCHEEQHHLFSGIIQGKHYVFRQRFCLRDPTIIQISVPMHFLAVSPMSNTDQPPSPCYSYIFHWERRLTKKKKTSLS